MDSDASSTSIHFTYTKAGSGKSRSLEDKGWNWLLWIAITACVTIHLQWRTLIGWIGSAGVGGGGGWRAGGEAISSMFIGEFVRDFIHQCLKKQHAVDKSELYDLHALEEILAHSSKQNKVCPLLKDTERHPSTFSFLQLLLFLRNQHSEWIFANFPYGIVFKRLEVEEV